MLSRKEGGVGYLIFNNPERHNAVSLDMWEAAQRHPRRLRRRQGDPRRGAHRRRRQGLRVGRRHLQVRERALQQGGDRALQRRGREGQHRGLRIPQADHRDDPRLLHRRRRRPGAVLRPAHLLGQFQIRRAGRQARPRLRLQGHQEAGRRGRAVLRQGNLLHRAPVHRRRGAARWAWSTACCRRPSSRTT